MRIREGGMPIEQMWESFFDFAFVLRELGLNSDCSTAVDLGCGCGTFAIPAARIVTGVVYAFDIEEEMIAAGFELVKSRINLPPYHYGMVGQKLHA